MKRYTLFDTIKAFAIFALAGYVGLLILSERAIRYLS